MHFDNLFMVCQIPCEDKLTAEIIIKLQKSERTEEAGVFLVEEFQYLKISQRKLLFRNFL